MRVAAGVALMIGLALAPEPAAAQQKATPYWVSIAAGEARMRSGPGRNFPTLWLYHRRAMPLKVVETYTENHTNWRKVQDVDGATGWMLSVLLSDTRTAIVVGGTRPLRATPTPGAKIVWRAEAGVIGRIKACANGWCAFDAGKGRKGYVQTAHLWGVGPDEVVR
ncbi:SH3 domain-containing protein [Sphingomonas flavalba]|uniref:SH3 domain-containing protein n=1 Tax=Sphingomonas flavalba TaxID=2559804 RepID=UPI0039E1E138